MMPQEASVHVTWPPDAQGPHLDVAIFNALIAGLKAKGLGFHYADAGPKASGTLLLHALAKALQYALPFDAKGTLARRAMHIPDCFTADVLKARRAMHIYCFTFVTASHS
jgi:hypothetical protein